MYQQYLDNMVLFCLFLEQAAPDETMNPFSSKYCKTICDFMLTKDKFTMYGTEFSLKLKCIFLIF